MRSSLPAAFAAALLLLQPAFAQSVKVGDIEVSNPWTRATPPRAATGGGFLTVTNTGDTPDRLIAVASPIAESGEVHEMRVEDGVMTMRPLADGLEIPAQSTVTLAPGGYHLMFVDLKERIMVGTEVPVTLTFEKAGVIETALHAVPIGAPGPEGGDAAADHGAGPEGEMQEGDMP